MLSDNVDGHGNARINHVLWKVGITEGIKEQFSRNSLLLDPDLL
jgi:hypothetical protein